MTTEGTLDHTSLFNLQTMMRVEKDLNALLDFIVHESRRIAGAERASLFLYDEVADQLWSKVAIGTEDIIRIDTHEGIAGEVFESCLSLNIEDAYEHPKFNPEVDRETGHKTTSILCVPLMNIDGRPIGVLQALNKKGGVFTDSDERVLTIFASNAAVALENARFIEELEDSSSRLEEENSVLRQKSEGKFFVNNLIGTSPKINEVVRIIEKVADSPLDVLISGESGTGKELASRMIHYNSSRSEGPFVDINCAALPDTILESELFGIEKGVATGVDEREGKIEQASGGTLFLDELGEMSLQAQAKLLRALQERKITRLGSKKSINVDIRIVTATNKDLLREIKEGNFREDLYYRLNVVHIKMPPLREIKEDIAVLAKHFLSDIAQKLGRGDMRISPETMKVITAYAWPGNIRELENEVKRASIMAEGDEILPGDMSEQVRMGGHGRDLDSPEAEDGTLTMKEVVERIEVRMIKQALVETGGNKEKASQILGLSRQGLFKKIKRYGL